MGLSRRYAARGAGLRLLAAATGFVLALSLVAPVLADDRAASPLPPEAEDSGSPEAGPAPTPAPSSSPQPGAPTPAAQPPAPPPPAAPAAQSGPWVANFEVTELHAAPDEASESLGQLRQFTYLQLQGHEGDWARVYNPRTRSTAYVRGAVIGPVDSPPAYVTAEPPPSLETINSAGRVVRGAALAYYPSTAVEVVTGRLGHNAPVFVADSVLGEDGAVWYRTADGDYLPSASVRLPRPPPRRFAGRWIDADLQDPAMLVAYEGDRPALVTLTIKGTARFPTPVGVFTIQRRVASETMNSETLGIPRNAPGGYYLTNVLYTQYFTGDGASIHYNYWSANWGYAASHGCLGLPYDESLFLWQWATIGTPISIHY